MAYLIPENLRSRTDVSPGVRAVAHAMLSGFDDDATFWFEPLFDPQRDKPSFVLLDPMMGIVVMELCIASDAESPDPIALAEGTAILLGVLRGRLRTTDGTAEQESVGPLDRAQRFARVLRERIAEDPLLGATPVTALAVFTDVTRERAPELGLDELVDVDATLFKDDLNQARHGRPGAVVRAISSGLQEVLDESIDDAQLGRLRGIIHPDAVIGGSQQGSLFVPPEPASSDVPAGDLLEGDPQSDDASDLEDEVFRVLDRQQEAMAKTLGSGHRVIRGVAGSGKTLVLVHRTRLLASMLPDKQFLVTCFTRSVASLLREELKALTNVEVRNINKLMADAIRMAGLPNPAARELPKKDQDWDAVAGVALDAIRLLPAPRYRAVMVDEAQDLQTEALAFCVELLESDDPDYQDLLVVADSAQNVFRRQFRWSDAGIKAQGRMQILRVNYRNTREILEFAQRMLVGDAAVAADEFADLEDELSIIPAESAERSGPAPTVTVTADVAAEIAEVIAQAQRWYTDRSPSRSIAVLVGHNSDGGARESRIVDALRESGVPTFWATDWKQQGNKDVVGSAIEPVIVSTIQSAKGLEYPKVVVCGLSAPNDDGSADAAIATRKLLYVAFTRAINELAVVTNSSNPFAAELESGSQDTCGWQL